MPQMDDRSAVTAVAEVRDSKSSDALQQRPSSSRKTADHVRRDSGTLTVDAQPGVKELKEQSSGLLDPLSEQILQRTSTPGSPAGLKLPRTGDVPTDPLMLHRVPTEFFHDDTGATEEVSPIQERSERGSVSRGSRKKKQGSFLSKIIGNKKKEPSIHEEGTDTGSDPAEERPEGADAELFYQAAENFEYAPHRPLPPPYIKVQSQGKKEKEFNRVFLAQRLVDDDPGAKLERTQSTTSTSSHAKLKKAPQSRPNQENGAVWAMEFSKDGRYLATAGQDGIVRLWSTLASRQDRRAFEKEEEAMEGTDEFSGHLNAPVFSRRPYRKYEGHNGAVLDLSWSKNNFLLSSSMDKTVKLWHVSRSECLCTFKHSDYVTSIQFHPKDDRFFLAGSLDSRLRLWSIPDKSVAYWVQIADIITAVAFTPDGKIAVAGCLNGACLFYETEGLRYASQMHVKSSHGRNAKGSKITGIQTIATPASASTEDIKLLITSNDSRVRLYNYRDKSLEMKLKGNENLASQIHARFSDDGRYIICGSEDNRVFIWSSVRITDYDRKVKHPVEVFEAHNAVTTVCTLAPVKTRQLLSYSEDPIYDICNPPPVNLVSKSEVESIRSFSGTENGSIQPTPATTESAFFKKAEESPAYLSRCTHVNGNIIVTADANGTIKVFRQDCAHEKRRHDMWDSASIISKKMGPGGLQRQSSVATRASGRSRQGSNPPPIAPPERILSWRQNISSGINSSTDKLAQAKRQNSEHGTSNTGNGKGFGRLASIRTTLGKVGSGTGSNNQSPNLALTPVFGKGDLIAEPENVSENVPAGSSSKASTDSTRPNSSNEKPFKPLRPIQHAATMPLVPSVRLSPDSPPTPGKGHKMGHHIGSTKPMKILTGMRHHRPSDTTALADVNTRNHKHNHHQDRPPSPSDSHSSMPHTDASTSPTSRNHHPATKHVRRSSTDSEAEEVFEDAPHERRNSYTYWRDKAWQDDIREQLQGSNRDRQWSVAFADSNNASANGSLSGSVRSSKFGSTVGLGAASVSSTRENHLDIPGSVSHGHSHTHKSGGHEAESNLIERDGLLMPPLTKSTSALSGVSALTSEMSSDESVNANEDGRAGDLGDRGASGAGGAAALSEKARRWRLTRA